MEETISVDFRKTLCKFLLVKQNFLDLAYQALMCFLDCIYNAKLQYLISSGEFYYIYGTQNVY